MLNYNLNIIEPLKQDKKNEDVRPPINWDFHSFASGSDNPDNNELGFATMSINAVNTNCIQVSSDSGNSFTTDAQSEVTASLTGSKWPVTGSTTMSLYTAGITYDPSSVDQYYFAAISASASQIVATPSVTGSIITSSFLASEFYRWFISGSIVHVKGNIWNPKVNYKIQVTSPSASYVSSSFLIVKDTPNVNVVSQIYTTSSNSGSVDYLYAFNMSASLSGSEPFWDSSYSFKEYTMSLSIPEIGAYSQSFYTNSNLTASWTATSNNPYNITASIELKPWTPFEVEIIAVGGGGAGGGTADRYVSGGGGGAGSYVSASWMIPVSPVLTSFDITIGAGGAGNTGAVSGSAGNDTTVYWNSSTSNVLIAKGGGGGGSATIGGGGSTAGSNTAAADGGSGGGATGGGNQTITLPATKPENSTYAFSTGSNGNNGASYVFSSNIVSLGGGGGGALSTGGAPSTSNGGAGGTGTTNLFGTFANGGAGGDIFSGFGSSVGANGTNASANTGNGGQGAKGGTTIDGGTISGTYRGGDGGSGIVIIRYRGPQVATGGTVTQTLNYTTHTFTSNGTFTPTGNFQCCHPQPINIEYLTVGGGGSGAGNVAISGDTSAGGGAGGSSLTGSLPLPESGNIFPVVVGLGAQTGSGSTSNGNTGGTSSIFTVTSLGGGGGGSSRLGSGAGGSNEIYTTTGGGGAGGGANGSGLNGGAGYQWVDGVYYAGGGAGAFTPGGGNISFGTNGQGFTNPGGGGAGNINTDGAFGQTAGLNGIVILRYNGNSQKATGGVVTYNNGYVYHTFASSSNFNVLY